MFQNVSDLIPLLLWLKVFRTGYWLRTFWPQDRFVPNIEGVALFSAVVAQLRAFHISAFCSLSKSCRRWWCVILKMWVHHHRHRHHHHHRHRHRHQSQPPPPPPAAAASASSSSSSFSFGGFLKWGGYYGVLPNHPVIPHFFRIETTMVTTSGDPPGTNAAMLRPSPGLWAIRGDVKRDREPGEAWSDSLGYIPKNWGLTWLNLQINESKLDII